MSALMLPQFQRYIFCQRPVSSAVLARAKASVDLETSAPTSPRRAEDSDAAATGKSKGVARDGTHRAVTAPPASPGRTTPRPRRDGRGRRVGLRPCVGVLPPPGLCRPYPIAGLDLARLG